MCVCMLQLLIDTANSGITGIEPLLLETKSIARQPPGSHLPRARRSRNIYTEASSLGKISKDCTEDPT
jgi:hypothetical protein